MADRPRASADPYATARGPLKRLAGPVAARARSRRGALLPGLSGLRPGHRVLDVGCGTLGVRALLPDHDVTGVDLEARPTYPGPLVVADAAAGLPFGDGAFDLVVSTSVVEHVEPARRARFAAELDRVGRGLYVQTPAFSFPVEPHALLPVAHWLPVAMRRPYWRLGAQGHWEDVRLLRRRELERLLPGTTVHAERLAGLAKSWIAVRPVPPR